MFCKKCGKELLEENKFCSSCGTLISTETTTSDENQNEKTNDNPSTSETVFREEENVPSKKKNPLKAILILSLVIVVGAVIALVVWNIITLNNYEKTLNRAYEEIQSGAEYAEDYATLESKVWRNCIYQNSSLETDIYTHDDNWKFYSDFNDALSEFYEGNTHKYNLVKYSVEDVDEFMAELKDPPSKYEDEYDAIRELYVTYSKLTDLVIGNTSYSCTSFTEALNTATSDYASAEATVKSLLD